MVLTTIKLSQASAVKLLASISLNGACLAMAVVSAEIDGLRFSDPYFCPSVNHDPYVFRLGLTGVV